MKPDKNNHSPARRRFLDWFIALCSLIATAAMGIPVLAYIWPAARGGAADNVEVEGAAAMSPGDSRTLRVGSEAVIVIRGRSGFSAFSAVCTHLGCLVKWKRGDKKFHCPCHAAVFDGKGQVVSGPAPAPLPKYNVKEIGDKVFVSKA